MLKTILAVLCALALLLIIMLMGLAFCSRQPTETGLIEGRLRPCPHTPNCVGSEERDADRRIAPLAIEGARPEAAWQALLGAVEETGGRIVATGAGYLHAEYRTPVWGFVDDLEARLEPAQKAIHLRSASRVGRSDLGTNRRRIERLHEAYARLLLEQARNSANG